MMEIIQPKTSVLFSIQMNHYQRNRIAILKKAHNKYHNGGGRKKAKKYYKENKKQIKKKRKKIDIDKWTNLKRTTK